MIQFRVLWRSNGVLRHSFTVPALPSPSHSFGACFTMTGELYIPSAVDTILKMQPKMQPSVRRSWRHLRPGLGIDTMVCQLYNAKGRPTSQLNFILENVK